MRVPRGLAALVVPDAVVAAVAVQPLVVAGVVDHEDVDDHGGGLHHDDVRGLERGPALAHHPRGGVLGDRLLQRVAAGAAQPGHAVSVDQDRGAALQHGLVAGGGAVAVPVVGDAGVGAQLHRGEGTEVGGDAAGLDADRRGERPVLGRVGLQGPDLPLDVAAGRPADTAVQARRPALHPADLGRTGRRRRDRSGPPRGGGARSGRRGVFPGGRGALPGGCRAFPGGRGALARRGGRPSGRGGRSAGRGRGGAFLRGRLREGVLAGAVGGLQEDLATPGGSAAARTGEEHPEDHGGGQGRGERRHPGHRLPPRTVRLLAAGAAGRRLRGRRAGGWPGRARQRAGGRPGGAAGRRRFDAHEPCFPSRTCSPVALRSRRDARLRSDSSARYLLVHLAAH